MKSIELTEKHKAKLLEMCNVLFPKNVHSITYDNLISLNGINEYIHWFEFCITHLFLKIFPDTKTMSFGKPCTKSNSIEHYKYLIYWLAGYPKDYFGKKVNLKTYHPIDYLYKQFKQLKHEKEKD